MNEKKRVACYCRVSTDSKEQKTSLDNQEDYFNEKITNTKDCALFRIYSDRGTSGTKLEREGFNKLLEDAGLDYVEVTSAGNTRKGKYVWIANIEREAKFDFIWVKDTSRFARNVLAIDIIRELASKQVYVNFLDVGRSTENESDMFVIQLFQTFDETESREKSRKVKDGVKRSAERGVLLVNSNIYGYEYKYDEKHKGKILEAREDEATVIREIFEMYSNGIGTRRIAKHLRDKGIRSRDKIRHNGEIRKGVPFSYTTIKCILNYK